MPNWRPGETLYIDGPAKYRIIKIVPSDRLDGSDYAGMWEVEPVV